MSSPNGDRVIGREDRNLLLSWARSRTLATRLVHYGLDDLDAGDIRRRTPRALTQEVSRYVFGRPEAYAGIRYLSRLGDELTNWGIFEGSEPDEILEENETIDPDDPDFVSALETLDLTLD